jgi:hypothetical protein
MPRYQIWNTSGDGAMRSNERLSPYRIEKELPEAAPKVAV